MNSLASKFASGIARFIPVGKQADDPITNIKAATRWLETLPIGDAYKCQQAILGEIKRFNENSTQFTKDRLAVLMLLDERARDLQDTLIRQYLRNPRMSRLVESQLWHAIYGMFWEVARGYHTFILNFSRASGKISHEDQIPLITLRAIQAFGQLLKWRTIRYLPAGEKLWLRLHNLHRVAETEGFHRKRQHAYSDNSSECSCESAYTHIMMLDLANSGSLYPRQLDLIDRWLCGWHEMLKLGANLDASTHNFVIDLSADHGPRRVRKPDTEKPLRFWATDELLFELNELQAALREGKAPAQLGLTEGARTVESLELLDRLQHHWASLATREQRRAPRESIKRLVDIIYGFNSIVDQVKLAEAPVAASPYGTGLNYDEVDDVQIYGFITDRTRERVSQIQVPINRQSPDVERWVMHDESECGYGAVVESRDKDWLRVGALIGAKSHDATAWQLGIVRRLSRLNDDTSSVGIETLVEPLILVMLYDTTTSGYTVNGFDNSDARLPHTGLWLVGASGKDSVIIDPAHYMPGKIFQIQGRQERKFIALGNPLERSEGWIRATAEPVGN